MSPVFPSPRRLHLLRHAKSGWDDPSLRDHARPLSSRGESATLALRRHWQSTGHRLDLVLCSTAERTRATWSGLAPGVPGEPRVQFRDDIYDADADALLALLRTAGEVDAVLLIGHNPAVSDLATGLLARPDSRAAERMAEKYPTGGLAEFSFTGAWSQLGYGGAELESFLRPRDLAPG